MKLPLFRRAPPGLLGARYIEHNLPPALPAGRIWSAQLTLRNEGRDAWRRSDPRGRNDDLAVFIDGQLKATYHLPCATVAPGAEVALNIPVAMPRGEGEHEVLFDMVRQNVALFSHRGVPPLRHRLLVTAQQSSRAEQLQERADRLCPWYFHPSGGIAHGRGDATYPLFIERAEGCRFIDVQGRSYLDYVMGWGSALLGYAEPRIQAAVRDMLGGGAIIPLPHACEIDVAQMLSEDIPCAQRVAFGKHGSDVCTLAARLARAYTGRSTILYSGYHGWQDWWVEQYGPAHSGVPERPKPLLHRFRANDFEHFDTLYRLHRRDLAAVFVEPAGAVEGPQGHSRDADPAFLAMLAERASEAGALLVFDEVLTGFRHVGGSVQRATGVTPDLCCLGKALGAGMPVSALVGSARVLDRAMGQTHYGPTYRGEAYSLAAARCALQIYREEPVAAHVHDHGERLRAGIDALCRDLGVAAHCAGPSFRSTLVFDDEDAHRVRLRRSFYFQELLKAGVFTYNGFMLPSYAHDDTALREMIGAAGRALEELVAVERRGQLHRAVEIPLL